MSENNGHHRNPKFALGQIVATPGALDALDRNGQSLAEFIQRHARCDWGDVCAEDAELNNEALNEGGRLLSSYILKDGTTKLWVITEADRSSSCGLLPSEY